MVIDREDDVAAVIIYVSMTTGLADPMYRRTDYVHKLQCNNRLSNKLVSKELVI